MKHLLGSLVIAFSMYSRIPMPQITWTKERMRYALCFFPLIGVVLGAAVAVSVCLTRLAGLNGGVRAALGTIIPLVITGGIHMDGFLDVVDARASRQPQERRLEILKDPHAGAFAILGCGVYLLLYAAAFSQLPDRAAPAFAGVFVLVRAFSGLSVVCFPKAKNTGLASAFSRQADRRSVAASMAAYILASAGYLYLSGGPAAAALCLLACLAAFGWYRRLAVKEFGGITGDLAGYFLQVCELLLLILLAAWFTLK